MGQRIIVGGRDRCPDLVVVQVVESAQLPLTGIRVARRTLAAPRTVPACNDHAVGCLLGDSDITVLQGSRRCPVTFCLSDA